MAVNDRVGGLVGSTLWTEITSCYSTSSVAGVSDADGLVGFNSGEIANSFWDMGSSGQTESSAGTGKTTARMKDISTFTDAGWSIAENDSDLNNGYPYLFWQSGGNSTMWYICEGAGPEPDPSPRRRPSPAPRAGICTSCSSRRLYG